MNKIKIIRRITIVGAILIFLILVYNYIQNYNREKEIKEVVSFCLPSFKIIHSFSDGNLWNYTSCYVIEFTKPLSDKTINMFKNNLIDTRENCLFKFIEANKERDTIHEARFRGLLGLSYNESNTPKIIFESNLSYYGELKEQKDPQKIIKFGFNTTSNCAVIKIIHM